MVHCVQGTQGWELAPGLWQEGETIINKPTFGYTGWADMDFQQVELVGLCTDICGGDHALLLKALFPEVEISVGCVLLRGVTPESHEAALLTMKMCPNRRSKRLSFPAPQSGSSAGIAGAVFLCG